MSSGRFGSLSLFGAAAIGGVAADLGSKSAVFRTLGYPSDETLVIVPNLLQFVTRLNQGGIWSFGAEHGVKMNTLLAIFSAVASVLILIWAYFGIKRGERFFPLVLGAILAGAIGNLFDRVVFQGVRDFIEVHYFDVWYYPTFNLADSFLVCGAGILIVSSLFGLPASENGRLSTKAASSN
jgi:signal peptidase II